MVKVKMRNPLANFQKKVREEIEALHHVESKLDITKRIDETRVFKVGCNVETDIFNKETKPINCDVSIIVDPVEKEKIDDDTVGSISFNFDQGTPSGQSKKDDDDD